MKIDHFKKFKQEGRFITMATCYEAWSAKLMHDVGLDCVLVGDSVAMVVHGYDSTIHATPAMMELHTEAVARGLDGPFLVADMPFMSYRVGLREGVSVATRLMRAGAKAVKLEGATGNGALIRHLVSSGVPVMGHLGLTPQSIYQLGGHKVQGKSAEDAQRLLEDAKRLESWGCFAVVLECVPEALAAQISAALACPVIGIGAGRYVDGQVLVLHDLLGLSGAFKPKFLRTFAEGGELVQRALSDYCDAVRNGKFPEACHVYGQQLERSESKEVIDASCA